jgi:hypothetical protein
MFLLALALAAVEPPPQPMTVEVVYDPITDRVRAYATARAEGSRVVVSCEPSRYEGARVSIHARRWLSRGSVINGNRPLTYRFDRNPARRMLWDVDDRRAQLTGRRRVRNFLIGMMRSNQVVIRTRDIENNRYDLTFPLVGARAAIEQALGACAARISPRRRRQYDILS